MSSSVQITAGRPNGVVRSFFRACGSALTDYVLSRTFSPLHSQVRQELYFLSRVLYGYRWDGLSPLYKPAHNYGKECVNEELQRRDAAALIRCFTVRGADCTSINSTLSHCLERESSHNVLSTLASVVEAMADVGSDCSVFVPFLERHAARERSALNECAVRILEKIEKRAEILARLEASNRLVCEKLTRVLERFNQLGLGKLPRVIVVLDCNTSTRFVSVNGQDFQTDCVKENGLGYDFPENTGANANLSFSYGKIRVYTFSAEDDNFEQAMLHEFIHLSKRARRVLKKAGKRLRKSCDENKAEFLCHVLEEGFTDFASKSAFGFRVPSIHAEHALAEVACEVAEKRSWHRVASDDFFHHRYRIGVNFFFQANETLNAPFSDYLQFISEIPPTHEELLSETGGTQWAQRVSSERKRI